MERTGPGPDREDFGEASLGEAQSSNPPDDPEMAGLSLPSRTNGSPPTVPSRLVHVVPPSVEACTYR